MESTTLLLQPFTWKVVDEEGEEGKIQIQCWALDQNNKPHLVRIENYSATCFVELPTHIDGRSVDWFDSDVDNFMKSLIQKLGSAAPTDYIFGMRPKLYYYQKKKFPMVHLTFDTLSALNKCVRILSHPFYFKGKGRGQAHVWEHKITLLRKFLTRTKLEPTQWFRINNVRKVPDERKISTLPDEYLIGWKEINPLNAEEAKGLISRPKALFFDIEAYSKNHKAFPDVTNTSDVCYMISVITQRIGLRETRRRRVIIYGDCRDIEDAEVIRVNSEIDCINKFKDLIKEEDPDIISGYNHHGFDNHYLNERLGRVAEEWGRISRLLDEEVELDKITWSSNAYGHNEIYILNMGGRISIDMLPVIKRDYKLPKYDLDTVSRFFLGRGKHPVKPEHIFKAYEHYWQALSANKANDNETTQRELDEAIDEMTRITRYCIEDAELTLDIAEKVHIWIASVELSNIVGVPIMDLYTRGQQIRCLSKIYNEAHRQGYVIDFKDPLNIVFNGGAVEKPEPGVEDEVPAYDVNSMYPNIMIVENIDHTTFVPDHLADTVKDEDCNIIEFDQLERPKQIADTANEEDFDPEIDLGEEGVLVHRRLRFVKTTIREGIIPKILRQLLDARRRIRNEMKPLEKAKEEGTPYDAIQLIVKHQQQLGLKLTANSFFGFLGAYFGRLPLIEGGMAITARGREIVTAYKQYLRDKYEARIVYGDTDSVMPKFFHLDGKPWAEKWAFWERINKELSDMFPGIILEMEKVMRIICFAPKMYAYLTYSKEGILTSDPKKIQAKGIILSRRDGTPWVRSHYRNILFNILWRYSGDLDKQAVSIETSFNTIIDVALDLKEGRVDWQELSKINGVSTKAKSPIAPLIKHLRDIGRPAQPGDRLQYVICAIPGAKKVGERMRTDDEYLESQETDNPLKLDVNYYLENALLKKIDPLFQVGYNKILHLMEDVGYKPFSTKHFVSISNPVKMISRVIEDGQDITSLKTWFKDQLDLSLTRAEPKQRKIIIRHRTPPIRRLD